MNNRRRKRIFLNVIRVILCISFLAQSSPLLAMSYERAAQPHQTNLQGSWWSSLGKLFADIPDSSDVLQPAVAAPEPLSPTEPLSPPVNAASTPIAFSAETGARPLSAPLSKPHQQPPPLLSEIPVFPDWNLLSIPTEQTNTDPAVVLAGIAGQYNAVFGYDGCAADPWQVYDPDAPPVTNDLTAVDHTIGFWIQATEGTTLPLTGNVPPSTTIEICTGWNLIGMPTEQARPTRNALFSIEGKYSLVFGYDPTDAEDPWEIYDVTAPDWANDLQMMQPGRGYWVLATEDTTLTFANEGEPPVARLVSPQEYNPEIISVTYITDVVGTAHSPFLESWTLSYRPQEESTWTSFATGTTPVLTDTLDQLDPTLLLNGLYEIRLTTTDYDGVTALTYSDIVIDGDAKIGNFSLSYVDMEIPLVGLPLQVIRSYDSRNKRESDFGVGWSLALSDIKLEETVAPGFAWESALGNVSGNPILPFFEYCLNPSQAHLVTITFPGNRVFNFRPSISPDNCQLLIPQTIVDITYEPLPGTQGTLTPLDQSGQNLLVVGGNPDPPIDVGDGTEGSFEPAPNEFWNQDSVSLYDPDLYRLTLPDGRSFVVSQSDGLQSISDLNDNTLTFSPDGVSHSNGKSIGFTRDEQGRITQITDPLSNTINYTYDDSGDLVMVTDQENETTHYTYNDNHHLINIVNARGVQPIRNEYDDDGRLIRHIDAEGSVITFTHNLDSRQEIVVDRLGNPTVIQYDAKGQVAQFSKNANPPTVFTYDDNGNTTSATSPLGQTITFAYDDDNNLTSETNILGYTAQYSYNDNQQLLTATDFRGNTITNTYDSNNNVISTQDALGHLTIYAYDELGNLSTKTDPLGCQTKLEYDSSGNIIREINALGYATAFTYDANNNQISQTVTRTLASGIVETLVTTVAYNKRDLPTLTTYPDGSTRRIQYNEVGIHGTFFDELNRPITYEYDTLGRVSRLTYADNTFNEFVYDADGRLLIQTDELGRPTQNSFDARGNLIQTLRPDNTTESTIYDLDNNVLSQTDGRNNTTFYGYDSNGLNTVITNSLGITTAFTYDENGNTATVTDANNNTTAHEYDATNRLVKITFANGTFIQQTYDAVGRLIAETDRDGNATHFQYDCLGQLISVTDALSQTTTYTYDEIGNRLTETDARNNTTRFDYDQRGRVITHTLPLGQVATMSYDLVGNLISKTDFNGDTTTYTYDARNRLIQETLPDTSTITYTYTPTGQRETVADSRGTTTYAYDELDRLLSVTHPDGRVISYSYDEEGNRTSVAIPVGTTTYTYDALNRLATVTDPDDGLTTYTYDLVGNLSSATYPNDTVSEYIYNNVYQLTNLANKKPDGSVLSSYAYTLNPNGLRTQVIEDNGRSTSYTYDDIYRLTAETITDPLAGNKSFQYTYDQVGNRLTKVEDGTPTIYTYDTNDRLLSEGSTTYSYDANGNMLSRNTATEHVIYDYDYQNRLTEAVTTQGTTVSTANYLYDADGIRIQSTIDGTNTTNYLVDINQPFAQVLLETDASNNTLASYVYGHDLISQDRAGSTAYYHYDGHGNTRVLSNSLGEITDTYTYEAFGSLLASTGSTANLYQYAGEQFDPNIGFYYLRARYYQPETGRFISRDPFIGDIQSPISLHKYLYANADPVNHIDPSGEFTLKELLVTIATKGILAQIAVGAITGAAFGGADAYFAEENVAAGVIQGMILGAALGPLAKVKYVGKILFYFGVTIAGWSTYDAYMDGDTGLALFRGIFFVAGASAAITSGLAASGNVLVYRAVNPTTGKVQYVGITNNFARRATQHLRRGLKIEKITEFQNLTRQQARGIEQVLIRYYGLRRDGGLLLNQINSIASTNPIYASTLRGAYWRLAGSIFGLF